MRSGISFRLITSDRSRLEALIVDRNTLPKDVWRAQIVLLSADGYGTHVIMRERAWPKRRCGAGRSASSRRVSLRDKALPPGIAPLDAEVVERIVALT